MKHWANLAILVPVFMGVIGVLGVLGLVGCSTTPDEPDVPTGIAVTSLSKGRLSGARAYYAVHAPAKTALGVIVDFDRFTEFRPRVTESRTISAFKTGGQAFLRFQGLYADDVNATCEYKVSESDGVYTMEYKMTDPSFALWAHNGSFTLIPAKSGEWTVIDQTVLISTLAFNRDATLAAMREDAEAFQRRIEELAGER